MEQLHYLYYFLFVIFQEFRRTNKQMASNRRPQTKNGLHRCPAMTTSTSTQHIKPQADDLKQTTSSRRPQADKQSFPG